MDTFFKKNKWLMQISLFAIVGVGAVFAVSAATNRSGLSFDSSEVTGVSKTQDTSAYNNEYISFNDISSGGPITRDSFPIRNHQIDSRTQYVNTPSDQIPESEFTVTSGRARHNVGTRQGNGWLAQSRTQCNFSHFAYDDPVVLPGQKDAAHLHTFFGNTLSSAYSTAESLLNSGSSTCNGLEGNRTSYWVPSVFDGNGNVRVPEFLVVYYKQWNGQPDGSNVAKTKPFPKDFGFVAGDARNGSSRMVQYVKWGCKVPPGGDKHLQTGVTIPSCSKGNFVVAHIQFPYCVKKNFDPNKVNSTASVEYTVDGSYWSGNCADDTFKIPAIEYFVQYKQDDGSGDSKNWRLTSDVMANKANGETNHADWLGGWNKNLFNRIMNNCIIIIADCDWDLVDDHVQLKRGTHFNRGEYTGPRSYPAREVSEKLCPGDSFSKTSDVAMCMNRALTSAAAIQYYNLDGDSNGASIR